jgi:hypothetical protein
MSNTRPKSHPVDETFVQEFTTRILDKAAGTAPEYSIMHGTPPKRVFFAGVLCGSPETQSAAEKKVHEIYRPTSCGLDFICRSGLPADLKIRLSFNVFGVVYQPFETLGARQAQVGEYLPTLSYVRFPVSFEFALALSDIELGMHELSRAGSCLNDSLARVSADIASRSDALREHDAASPKTRSLREWTGSAYRTALHEGQKVPQSWRCSVVVQGSDTEAGRRIQLFLQNTSAETEGTLALDRNFYGSEISINIDHSVLNDIPLERAALNDYRYRRSVIVQGINCNSSFDADGTLRTCFTPSFTQMRYLPLQSYDLTFARVRDDTNAVFDEVDAGLHRYADAWRARLKVGELDIRSEGTYPPRHQSHSHRRAGP